MLSIVVPWRDRVELAAAIPQLVGSARAVHGDLTIVNFGGSADLLRRLLAEHVCEVQVVESADQPFFNKAKAQNIGAGATTQPVLFFCDCDILLEPQLVESLANQAAMIDGLFATLAGVRESESNSRRGNHVVCFGYELRIRTSTGRTLRIVDNEEDIEDGTRQAPGLLFVRRSDFLAVNGYNGRLHGWGWDDQDMIARLTLGRGLRRASDGCVIHLSHDDQARMQAYSTADRWESRDRMFRQALANYDRADFFGTYDIDNAEIPVHRWADGRQVAVPNS